MLYGHGDGTFAAPLIVNIDAPQARPLGSGTQLATADVDGDGHPDLFIGAYGLVFLALSRPGQTFAMTSLSGAGSGDGFVIGDFNGDGIPDIAFKDADSKAGLLGIVFLRRDGSPGVGGGYVSIDLAPAFAADYNGDGRADLVGQATSGTAVALTDPNGFPSRDHVYADITNEHGTPGLGSADMNGDGLPDVLSFTTMTVGTHLAKRGGTLENLVASPLPPNPGPLNGLAIGDLDGNKVPDLLAFTDAQVLCLHGDKTGAFAPWSTNLTADQVAQDLGASAALVDLNRDGKLDLVEADLHTTRVFLQQ